MCALTMTYSIEQLKLYEAALDAASVPHRAARRRARSARRGDGRRVYFEHTIYVREEDIDAARAALQRAGL